MDSKLLLVKAIMLLYREGQLEDSNGQSAPIIKEVIEALKPTFNSAVSGSSKETLVALRDTLLYMLEEPAGYRHDKDTIIQRLRVNIIDDESLFKAVELGMVELETEERIQQVCYDHLRTLRQFLSRNTIKNIIKQASQDVHFNEESVNWKTFAADLVDQLEPYASNLVENTQGLVDEVDISDIDKLESVIQAGEEANSTEGIMRTGWQGLNRMTGEHGGIRRGDFVLIGALQHNFKSGMLLNIPKHVALYNRPYMLDPKRKPLILNISLENKIEDNILILYKNLKENETNQPVSIKDVDFTEAAAYLKEKLSVNGYHYKFLRFDPTDFTYRDLFELLDRYIAEGYEIHLVSLDYLNMMSKAGCSAGINEAFRIRELFRRVRNYCNPKGITFLTAHQLSSEAKQLVRNGSSDFVKEIANKGYYDSAKGIDQEVDLEIGIHIEKPGDGHSYLTMGRGKHRKAGSITPDKDLFCVYRFENIGDIPDDIHGSDLSRRSVGGGVNSQPGAAEGAWWDLPKNDAA